MPRPRIIIEGYCGKTEMRFTPGGTEMLKFSLGVDTWSPRERDGYKEGYKGNGFVATAWQNCVVWGDKAKDANEWLNKGMFVKVSVQANGSASNGAMYPRVYEDKQTGEMRTSYEWTVKEFLTDEPEPEYEPEVEESEIPF